MRLTQHLRQEAKHVDYLILWLDCDSEGENICFEVINSCMSSMKVPNMSHIFRARFSGKINQVKNRLGIWWKHL